MALRGRGNSGAEAAEFFPEGPSVGQNAQKFFSLKRCRNAHPIHRRNTKMYVVGAKITCFFKGQKWCKLAQTNRHVVIAGAGQEGGGSGEGGRTSHYIRQIFSLHAAASGRARSRQHPAKWETCMRWHPPNEMCTTLTRATNIFFPLVGFPAPEQAPPPSFCGEPMCRGCETRRQARLQTGGMPDHD